MIQSVVDRYREWRERRERERERAREVHPVPVRGPLHALYEVVMRHTTSLGERPARVAAARKRPGREAPAPCCEEACGV